MREIALGIREFDARALNSAHCAPRTAAIDYWDGESWLQVNNVYARDAVYTVSLAQYARAEQMPFFFLEGAYENEPDGTEQSVRVQAYHALLSGAAGQVFGNNPIWHFSGPGLYSSSLNWQQSLNSRGVQSMTHVRTLFAPRSWWTLQPDSNNTTLTGGLSSGQDEPWLPWRLTARLPSPICHRCAPSVSPSNNWLARRAMSAGTTPLV